MIQGQVLEARRDVSGGYKVDVGRGERVGRVSSEWFSRPDDERYLSLDELTEAVRARSERSRTQGKDRASTPHRLAPLVDTRVQPAAAPAEAGGRPRDLGGGQRPEGGADSGVRRRCHACCLPRPGAHSGRMSTCAL